MSTHLQAKLLRVLEDREIRPVGATKPVRVEVRIVAATNRDLAQAMARGTFREDLFYRLNVISVGLPSLRERREDIPLLANHFLQKFTELAGATAKVLSPEALACLEAYAWPGNIRELENVIERAMTLEPGPIIRPESLPESLRRPRAPDAFHVDFPPEGIDLDKLMEQIERDLIRRALERVDGVQSRAAQLLGTGFRSFRYRLQKYGMIDRSAGSDGGLGRASSVTICGWGVANRARTAFCQVRRDVKGSEGPSDRSPARDPGHPEQAPDGVLGASGPGTGIALPPAVCVGGA